MGTVTRRAFLGATVGSAALAPVLVKLPILALQDVTDRSMWSHVTRHKLPERYETVVISRLAELLNHM